MKEISIYGAGLIGFKTYEILKDRYKVNCFIDKKRSGEISNIQIVNPSETNAKEQPYVFIALFNPNVNINALKEELEDLGYIISNDFINFFLNSINELQPSFWLHPKEIYIQNLPKIYKTREILQDQKSKNLLSSIYEYRISGDSNTAPLPDLGEIQYFPSDIPGWLNSDEISFLDIGSFHGENIIELIKAGKSIKECFAFEPDPENFNNLIINTSSIDFKLTRLPIGVSDKFEILKFNSGETTSSSISEKGDTYIQCIDIDSLLSNIKINFIKMDIEGYELAALKGAKKLIETNKPFLAISLYHKPNDLWEIPQYIKSIRKDYKFYLRTHLYQTFDTVLYCL